MPTIVGILTFMSRINFMLSSVEHEKSFITLGPGIKPVAYSSVTVDERVHVTEMDLVFSCQTVIFPSIVLQHVA